MKSILLIHAAATLMMTGVIWMVQVVHYPLFNRVGIREFQQYEADHTTLITLIVFPLMTIELITAFSLALAPPGNLSRWIFWVGLGLVGVAWVSTAFIQLPLHTRLSNGFDASAYQQLVHTNWLRTLTWSLRSSLVLWSLNHLLNAPS